MGGGGWLDARGWACKAGATARRTCPAAVAARSAAHAASSAAAGRRRVRVAVMTAGSRLFRRRARGASLPCAGSGCQPTALNQRAFPLSPSPPRGESHADRSCLSSILPHTTGLAPRLARAWPIVGPRLRLVGWAQPCDRPAMPPARNLAWAQSLHHFSARDFTSTRRLAPRTASHRACLHGHLSRRATKQTRLRTRYCFPHLPFLCCRRATTGVERDTRGKPCRRRR